MKPAYRVPTLRELESVKGSNGYKTLSTFSGVGGACLGLEMAGFDIRAACEFIPEAVRTYKVNHPGVPVIDRDIRTVTAAELLAAAGLEPGEVDLFEGSPPCASFSTAGARERGWGKVKQYSDGAQRSDDLFFEYARLVREIQPRAFVAENVSGLVKGTAKGYFIEILEELKSCGYRVSAKLLDAQWLGVPQSRQRLIFVGVRNDLVDANGKPIQPAFPTPLPYRYSINDALRDLDAPVEPESSMRKYAVAGEWYKLPLGGQSPKYFQLVRCHPERPVPTITATSGQAGAASVSHPYECRKFSVAETIRLCSFPDDLILTGTFTQRIERLGRSVPPLLYKAVGEVIAREILDKDCSRDRS